MWAGLRSWQGGEAPSKTNSGGSLPPWGLRGKGGEAEAGLAEPDSPRNGRGQSARSGNGHTRAQLGARSKYPTFFSLPLPEVLSPPTGCFHPRGRGWGISDALICGGYYPHWPQQNSEGYDREPAPISITYTVENPICLEVLRGLMLRAGKETQKNFNVSGYILFAFFFYWLCSS